MQQELKVEFLDRFNEQKNLRTDRKTQEQNMKDG